MLDLFNIHLRRMSFSTAWQIVKERSHSQPKYQNILEGMHIIKDEYDREFFSHFDEKDMLLYCIKNQRPLTAYNIVFKELADLFNSFEENLDRVDNYKKSRRLRRLLKRSHLVK